MAEPLSYNCHIVMWNLPPQYVCMLCLPTDTILPYDALVTHLADVHHTTPVPTPITAPYLQNLATRMGPPLTHPEIPIDQALALMQATASTPLPAEEPVDGRRTSPDL